MEYFRKTSAVKLRSHLDKYLIADDDMETVRQSRNGGSRKSARWIVETVESNEHVVRLKSVHGRYLTASNVPFLLGMTGNKVVLNLPEGDKDLMSTEWKPIRDGFQVKLRAYCGTYLRGNGGMPPWRNTVTHDDSFAGPTHNWILWDVEGVDVPVDEQFHDYMSMVSNLSSVSDEISGLEYESPVSVHSSFSPRTPNLSMNKQQRTNNQTPPSSSSAMELFDNAKAVRLRSHHDKYVYAEDDHESVTQDRDGSSKNARWTVEVVQNQQNTHGVIRLKSCYNKYLTASNQPFLLGMTGRKVLQTAPSKLDSSVEWEPVKDGKNQVKLKTRYGQFLRANGGLPPWRNSVTHDIPHRTATQDWILWDVDIVDIIVQSPAAKPPPPLVSHSDSFASSESDSPLSSLSHKSPAYSRQESSDLYPPPRRDEGRAIYYHIIADGYGEMDENAQGFCIHFKGNNVQELTRMLEEETGMRNITVCSCSPLDHKLYPLRLQLPPNNVTMKVVVVQSPADGE